MGSGKPFTIVDTPGFGDSDGQEGILIDEMVKLMKDEVKSTNVFLLLFHGQVDYVPSGYVRLLRELPLVFGPEFWSHAMIGFTHWSFDQGSIQARLRK